MLRMSQNQRSELLPSKFGRQILDGSLSRALSYCVESSPGCAKTNL
jgi:hypothetical protein